MSKKLHKKSGKLTDKKSYKNLAEIRAPNIDEINTALAIVRQFIIRKKLVVYGGMSLDLNLKKRNHVGLYTLDTLPDYDFYSANSYADSIELADILHKRGFYNVSAINALHITTRRVRIDFVTVADISYCPENIFKRLPINYIDGMPVLHADYQRIDMHLSIAGLFDRFPHENYLNRLGKDLRRYNILDSLYPVDKISPVKSASAESTLINHFKPRLQTVAIVPTDGYYTGIAAYAIYYEHIVATAKQLKIPLDMSKFAAIKRGKTGVSLMIDNVEIMKPITAALVKNASASYNRTMDILPGAIIVDDTIIYDAWGLMIAGCVLPSGIKVVGAQYALGQLLFKYLMTGHAIYHAIYKNIIGMVTWAETNYTAANRDYWRTSPLVVNDNVMGEISYDENHIYAIKEIDCIEKGIDKKYKPIFGYYPSNPNETANNKIRKFNAKKLEVYQTGGYNVSEYMLRNLDC